jgi:RNA polymerase sigma-70 factor (ECF subfamily)
MTTLATGRALMMGARGNKSDARKATPTRPAPAGLGDDELLKRVRARDRRALEALYDRYSARALGIAFKVLRERDLAEQVVVDSFWRVWERAGQFEEGRGTFSSWFFGIVRHLAIDEFRRREARPAPSEDQQLELALNERSVVDTDVATVVAERLAADALREAVNALPPSQRQVIHLAYFEGLTRKEISDKLGQPLGTIHTRARLGLDKLRTMLSGAGA